MRIHKASLTTIVVALLLTTCGVATAQETLPLQPVHDRGDSVTGAFEGWFPNNDGSFSILVGYFNRNEKEAVDVPIGPNNQIQPGGPDRGQPSHFMPGRGWGLFAINVPKDWGDKTLTWTLTVNGITTSTPLSLAPLWRIAPFIDATGDAPAYIGFSDGGPFVNGPVGQSETLIATVGTPLRLAVWVADDAKYPALPSTPPAGGIRYEDRERQPVSVQWTMYRGPETVQFDDDMPAVERVLDLRNPPEDTIFYGRATTNVIFSEPGNYVLSVQAWDSTGPGGDGFQCCYSDAKVNVSVKP